MGEKVAAKQDGGGSQPEERHGVAAEVHRIHHRQKKPVRRVFELNVFKPDIFCGAATRSASSTNPSPFRYPLIDRMPKARCLGLSQRHSAYRGGTLAA
jgi:hypothetical protein